MLLVLFSIGQCATIGYTPHLRFSKNPQNTEISAVYSVFDNIPLSWGKIYLQAFQNATSNLSDIEIPRIQNLAESNYPPAVYLLGDLYFYGFIKQDFEKAAKLYKKAAKLGFNEGLARLSLMHKYGLGVERDSAKSALYRMVACEGESLWACLSSANAESIEYGKVRVPNNMVTMNYAFMSYMRDHHEIYRASDKMDFLQEDMTFRDEKKDRVNQEMVEGHKYQSHHGNAQADIVLGSWYLNGEMGMQQDWEQAKILLMRHADNPDAQAILGVMHLNGIGFPNDIIRARQYFQKAVMKDNALAMNGLGVAEMQTGDPVLGQQMIRNAAERGNLNAMNNLALMEAKSGNFEEARKYADMSAQAEWGDVRSHLTSGSLRLNGGMWDWQFADGAVRRAFAVFSPLVAWTDSARLLWDQGNRKAALLTWMELTEIGDRNVLYFPIKITLNCEKVDACIVDGDERDKLIVRLGEFVKAMTSPSYIPMNILQGVLEAYQRMNKTKKAQKWIDSNSGQLVQIPHEQAKAMLNGYLQMDLPKAFLELTSVLFQNTESDTADNLRMLVAVVKEMVSKFRVDSKFRKEVYNKIILPQLIKARPWINVVILSLVLVWLMRRKVQCVAPIETETKNRTMAC